MYIVFNVLNLTTVFFFLFRMWLTWLLKQLLWDMNEEWKCLHLHKFKSLHFNQGTEQLQLLGEFRTTSVVAFMDLTTTVYIYPIVIYHLKGTFIFFLKIPFKFSVDFYYFDVTIEMSSTFCCPKISKLLLSSCVKKIYILILFQCLIIHISALIHCWFVLERSSCL